MYPVFKKGYLILAVAALTLGAIFLDIITPLGYAEWVFYLFPLLLVSWAAQREYVYLYAGIATVAVYLGMYISPEGQSPHIAVINRTIMALSLWVTAYIMVRLRAAVDGLRRQARFINLSPDAIISRKVDGTITFWSAGAERLYGWPCDEAVGRSTHELLHTEFPIPFDQILEIMEQDGHWTGELVHTARDGRKIIVNSRWLLDPDSDEMMESNVDITDRKQAEEALRESEERFRALADNIPNLAWMADRNGWIFWYNQQWYDYTGTTLEEMQGWGWQKVHHPDYIEAVTEEWNLSLRTGRPYDNVFPLRGKDGNYRWFLTRITPIRDAGGNIQRWFGTNTDITDRKRAEEELEQISKQRQLALDAAQMGWWHYDPESGIATYDEQYTRIFGVAGHERPIDEILKLLHPEDLPGVWAAVEAALNPEDPKSYSATYRIIRPDGAVRWIEAHGIASFAGTGQARKAVSLIGTVADITDRKLAEEAIQYQSERVRAIVETAVDGIITIDERGIMQTVNPAVTKIFGYTPKEMVGQNVTMLMPEPYFSEHDQYLANYLRTGEKKIIGIGREVQGKRKDGSIFPLDLAVSEMHVKGRRLFTGLLRDITLRKQMEEKLQETVAGLTRSNAELEQFAYVASHDLQEPLRMVASYVQLLQRRYQNKLDSEADEFIHYAADGARRMQRLIEDLLAFSRVGTRGQPFKPLDLQKVLDQVETNLRVAIQESGAVITADPLPVVQGDESQLIQLFQNLLDNAIKFHDAEIPRVHISAIMESRQWRLSVQDNGIGIDPRYFDRIFLVFQRLHGKDKYPGTGIGLAICKKIVERHGGKIWVEAGRPRGTIFHFTLPA